MKSGIFKSSNPAHKQDRRHADTQQALTATQDETVLTTREGKHKRTRITICILIAVIIVTGASWGAYRAFFAQEKAIPTTKDVSDAVSQFTYRSAPSYLMDKDLLDNKGNANYSSASLWMSLSMVLQGASGGTKTELEQNLNAGKPLNVDDYHSLNLSINGKYEGKSEMKTANGVWANKNKVSPSEQLKQSIKSGFDGTIKTTDFNENTAKQMSSWVSDKTHGKLKPNINVSRNAAMVLINTVYADGRWPEPFEKDLTTTETFHGTNGGTPVPMMSQSERMLTAEGDTWTRLDKQFDNQGELKIVLPKEDSQLDALAKNPDALRTAFSADSSDAQVNLKLPRFTINSDFTSSATIQAMQQLGIRQAFGHHADFAAMTKDKNSVSISEIIQGTKIEVEEAGAEAAAYTKTSTLVTAPAPSKRVVDFIVDRPFLYEYATPDGVPLFIGVVRNL